MYCVDCQESKIITVDSETTDLICCKYDKSVFPFNKCLASKKYLQDEKAKKLYLELYQTVEIREIARRLGWTENKLRYFVEEKLLPKKWGE